MTNYRDSSPPVPTRQHMHGGRNAALVVVAIVITAIVALPVIGFVMYAFYEPGGGAHDPVELSANDYVDRLCSETGSIVEQLPPASEVSRNPGIEDVDTLLAVSKAGRKVLVGTNQMLLTEDAFAQSNMYDGVGGNTLRTLIASSHTKAKEKSTKALDAIDKAIAAMEGYAAIDSPSDTQRTDYGQSVAEALRRFKEVMADQRPLPGSSDILFISLQSSERPVYGDLEKALAALDDAARNSDACRSTLEYLDS